MPQSARILYKTQTHQMVWVGQDLKGHLVPTPAAMQGMMSMFTLFLFIKPDFHNQPSLNT